jgi:hypothetical protein
MTPFVSPITKSPCLQAQRDHGRLKPPDLTDRIHRHVSLWLWGKFWKIESTKSKLSLWTIQYNSMFRMTLQWLYQNSGARTDQNWHETLQRQTIGHPKTSDYDVRHAMKRYHIMIIMWCSVAMPGFFLLYDFLQICVGLFAITLPQTLPANTGIDHIDPWLQWLQLARNWWLDKSCNTYSACGTMWHDVARCGTMWHDVAYVPRQNPTNCKRHWSKNPTMHRNTATSAASKKNAVFKKQHSTYHDLRH